jgi:aerobic-type carbon monoxide dehydrogenase small subunit (CoxS/CutS family)
MKRCDRFRPPPVRTVTHSILLLENRQTIMEMKHLQELRQGGTDMVEPIEFSLNRKPVKITTDGERKLLWVLRTELGLTGTKYGCGEGICGACTVVIDGKAMRSCQASVKDVRGRKVVTIEGLADDGGLHPLQEAFLERGAFQCGYCTSGMIMNAWALLLGNPRPTEADIIRGMNDNLCRCGAYKRIVEAIQVAAAEMVRMGGRP